MTAEDPCIRDIWLQIDGEYFGRILGEFNITNKEVQLIFFMDAKQHIKQNQSNFERQPRMLVGVGGTGKQSLTRLAYRISDIKCHQIELTRTYGLLDGARILKLYVIGAEGKKNVLSYQLQIKSGGSSSKTSNSILNSGEIQNLFENDEREDFGRSPFYLS
jgi:dynein heavy chain